EPRLEPVTIPALRLDQYSPSGLNEQNTQVAVAAFRYLAKDGAVAGRDLLGDQPQPSSEVAAFRECVSSADRSHHRAGDDWPDPRYAPRLWCPLPVSLAGGAGVRPDHPISGQERAAFAAAHGPELL